MTKWPDFTAFAGISAVEWLSAGCVAVVAYLVLTWVLKIAVARLEIVAN